MLINIFSNLLENDEKKRIEVQKTRCKIGEKQINILERSEIVKIKLFYRLNFWDLLITIFILWIKEWRWLKSVNQLFAGKEDEIW